MQPFAYHAPSDLAAARALLDADPEARLLAGGMSLLPTMKLGLATPSMLVDLGRIDSLVTLVDEGEQLCIGAMTTHAAVARSALVGARMPALAALAGGIGDVQVRHRGTLGGALANNDPAADYPAAALALDAEVQTDRRRVAAAAFFTDMFETALEPGEIVTAVRFPVPHRAIYLKLPQPASRYAVVGVFAAVTTHGLRIAVTGAAPLVFRATAFEEALAAGAGVDDLRDVAVDPGLLNDDPYASADYRAAQVGVLVRRAVAALNGAAGAAGPG